jgi:hypothetical protein
MISIRSIDELLDIVRKIRNGITRAEIRDQIKDTVSFHPKSTHLAMLNASVDLAARVVTMMRISQFKYRRAKSEARCRAWNDGTLQEAIEQHFEAPRSLDITRIRLEKNFTTLNLHRMAGFRIQWTDNLADHLRLVYGDTMVNISPHISFLEYARQRQAPKAHH